MLRYICSIPLSIVFNLRFLPVKQAIKLPIIVYGLGWLRYIGCSGRVRISSSSVKPMMVRLGFPRVSIFPRRGIMIENNGLLEFKGNCIIGNNSYISIGSSGHLIFGDCFSSTASLKCVSYKSIEFDKNVLVGWECLFTDTDLHTLSYVNQQEVFPREKSIYIGANSWLAYGNTVLKGTHIPAKTIVGAKSLLNRKYDIAECSLLAGNPAEVVKENVIRID